MTFKEPMKFHRRLYSWLSCIFERMALFVLWIADGDDAVPRKINETARH